MGLFDKLFGPPSKDKFARLLSNAIREAGETVAIRYDAKEFRLVVEGGEKRFFNLVNIYREYCAVPSTKRRQALSHFVKTWFANRKEIPANFEDVGPDLLPAIRNRCSFEMTRLKAELDGLPSLEWPHRVVADHLTVSLVYDLPEALVQVQQQHLSDWGRSLEEALDAACDNLRNISHHQWNNPFPGVWISPWHDNHDASRLVLTDLLQVHPVQGAHVAMVPNRDTLIVTGSDDETGLAHMAEHVEKALDHARPITGLAFLLDNETWLPWLPDADHPLHDQFHMLQLQSIGRDYAAQKDLLDASHEKTGKNIWVASYSAVRNDKTGQFHSYCVWSQGVDTLLPKADQVYFFVPKGEKDGSVVARASWDRVQQVVGHLMESQGVYPVRYRAKEFPTAGELARMGGASMFSDKLL
jgi:uncharacterized protein YtpQ (UPF0354 family)